MSTLAQIAQDMQTRARSAGVSSRQLARGLTLCLTHVGGKKTPILSRLDTKPGEVEVTICRDAFAVPAEARRDDGQRSVTLRWPSQEIPRE